MPADRTRSKWTGLVTIPWPERKKLLDNLGVLDIPFGKEEVEARKSNFFFRTLHQATAYDANVLKPLREKRNEEISNLSNKTTDSNGTKTNSDGIEAKTDGSLPDLSAHERARRYALGTMEEQVAFNIDPEKGEV